MAKVNLINPEHFLKESAKVVQIVKENQARLRKELQPTQRLSIVKELLEKSKDVQEYKMLKEKEAELEIEVRLGKGEYDAIPKEKRELILRNRNVEELEINEQLNEYKEQIVDLVGIIEDKLIPLVKNIELLEHRKLLLKDVDLFLNGIITRRSAGFTGSAVDTSMLISQSSNEQVQANSAKKALQQALEKTKKIQVPKKNDVLSSWLGKGARK